MIERVGVGAVEPETGEECERADGEEEGRYAERRAGTSCVGDCGAAGVVATSTVCGSDTGAGAGLSACVGGGARLACQYCVQSRESEDDIPT